MISILPQQLDYNYQDSWGEYLPPTLEALRPLIEAGCYVPRWYQAPTDDLEAMVAGDYSTFTLQILPGTYIHTILHSFQEGMSGSFTVQITDLSLNHQWFSQPAPDAMFYKENGRNGYVLPKPYPIITPGNLVFERWCTTAGACELIFAVVEPTGAAARG